MRVNKLRIATVTTKGSNNSERVLVKNYPGTIIYLDVRSRVHFLGDAKMVNFGEKYVSSLAPYVPKNNRSHIRRKKAIRDFYGREE